MERLEPLYVQAKAHLAPRNDSSRFRGRHLARRRQHMRALPAALRFASILAVLALATPALADHHTVKVAKSDKLGSYLTDAKGMTLYVFKKDSPGKSACAGDCVTKWPLYYRESVGISGSLKAGDFATITREDGQKQTTYKGLPLYYFAADKAPGDVNGQGVRDVWYVVAP
jgi:predicted lipoprotein with Yx(FWY)xxD motif